MMSCEDTRKFISRLKTTLERSVLALARDLANKNSHFSSDHTRQLDEWFLVKLAAKMELDGFTDEVFQSVSSFINSASETYTEHTGNIENGQVNLGRRSGGMCSTAGCNVPIILQPIYGYAVEFELESTSGLYKTISHIDR